VRARKIEGGLEGSFDPLHRGPYVDDVPVETAAEAVGVVVIDV